MCAGAAGSREAWLPQLLACALLGGGRAQQAGGLGAPAAALLRSPLLLGVDGAAEKLVHVAAAELLRLLTAAGGDVAVASDYDAGGALGRYIGDPCGAFLK